MNINKYALLIMLGILIFILYKPHPHIPCDVTIINNTIYLPSFITSLDSFIQQSTIKNTELAWDVHEVLVKKDYYAIIKTLWYYKKSSLTFLYHLVQETLMLPFTFTLGKAQNLLRTILQLKKNHATGEAYEHALRTSYPELADMIVLCINHQKPVCGIKNLLHTIAQKGYIQRIASNIGITHYPLLAQQFPQFFSYFQSGTVTQCDAHNGIKKPNPRFFWNHIHTFAKHKPHFFIFLDNDRNNVIAAARAGMIAIEVQYLEQVIRDLHTLGILK